MVYISIETKQAKNTKEKNMKKRLRDNWREFLAENAASNSDAYIVFEEDDGKKNYDLNKGVFNDLEVAKEYAQAIFVDENIYIARFSEYVSGNYDYLYEVKE